MLKRHMPIMWVLYYAVLSVIGVSNAVKAEMTSLYEGQSEEQAISQSAVKIVTSLPLDGLAEGRHHFYLKAGWTNTGQEYQIPVIILQGAEKGKRILFNSGTHGDELNGIHTVHKLANYIETDKLAGQIVMIAGLNQTGMRANSRHYTGASGGGFKSDLNRNFPGKGTGSIAERFLSDIWVGAHMMNFDYVIDMHTQTRGTSYPLFVFSDFRNKTARAMAYALMPDVIKNDKGEEGTLETTMVSKKIPAVTLEIGSPKLFQHDLIDRAILGVENVLRLLKFYEGDVIKPFKGPIVGKTYTNVKASRGGPVAVHVALLDMVKKGQKLATQYDPFGQVVKEYFAPHEGIVLATATDPLREDGAMIVRILQ